MFFDYCFSEELRLEAEKLKKEIRNSRQGTTVEKEERGKCFFVFCFLPHQMINEIHLSLNCNNYSRKGKKMPNL